MCLMDSPDPPPTPEPAAPPAPAAEPPKMEVKSKVSRRSDQMSAKAKGTRRYRNDTTSLASGSMSGLNIPT